MTMPFDTSIPLTLQPRSGLFDMRSLGSRVSGYRFDLIDVDGVRSDPLTPLRGSPPVLAHDTSRTVKRTLTMTLGVADTRRFDPVRDRVEPVMIMGDGVEFPLGRYMAVDGTLPESTGGDQVSVALTDELTQVQQQIATGFSAMHGTNASRSIRAGTNIRGVIRDFLARYPLFNPRVGEGPYQNSGTFVPVSSGGALYTEADIDATPYATSTAWQSGTSGGQVLEDLALAGDYFSPWIGNDKTFHMIRTFDPADRVPLVDWDLFDYVIRSSVTRANDLLTAPNRFVVIANSGVDANENDPVVGRYDVPASAPWSIRNRGFVVPNIVSMEVQTPRQAASTARAIGLRQTVFERITASTPPDPRHDSYDVVLWRGERWLELAWTMTLIEGAPMQHSLRKVYADA